MRKVQKVKKKVARSQQKKGAKSDELEFALFLAQSLTNYSGRKSILFLVRNEGLKMISYTMQTKA